MTKGKGILIVNLMGSPGAGKSTGAAYIFSQLKLNQIPVELVTEFAKDKLYEENQSVFENQIYIFGKQYFKMSRIKGVNVIITDSPLILQALYAKKYNFPYKDELIALIKKVISMENSINYFINRDTPYGSKGRFQTKEESDEISNELKSMLSEFGLDYKEYKGNIDDYNRIVQEIIEEVNK